MGLVTSSPVEVNRQWRRCGFFYTFIKIRSCQFQRWLLSLRKSPFSNFLGESSMCRGDIFECNTSQGQGLWILVGTIDNHFRSPAVCASIYVEMDEPVSILLKNRNSASGCLVPTVFSRLEKITDQFFHSTINHWLTNVSIYQVEDAIFKYIFFKLVSVCVLILPNLGICERNKKKLNEKENAEGKVLKNVILTL